MNVAELLQTAGALFSERPAVGLGEQRVRSYAELTATAAALAGSLRAILQAGDRVAVFATNTPEIIETMFAIWWAGLVAVPINAKLHPDELAYILADSGSELCFASADKTELARSVSRSSGIPNVVSFDSQHYAELRNATPVPMTVVERDTLAWLFYTSGTTGVPKGAMISHGNLLTMSEGYFQGIDGVAPGDVLLHAAPMSHGSGLYMVPFVAAGGLQVVTPSGGFDPAEIFELIPRLGQVSMFAAPTMGVRLIRHAKQYPVDIDRLRTIVFGGGPLYLEVIREAYAVFGGRFAQLYGQGECPMTITGMHRARMTAALEGNDERYLLSVGHPFEGTDIRIDRNDGSPADVGEVGEIWVRSSAVCLGYWRRDEATAEAFVDGWLRTGDLGHLDADSLLTLGGRSKEMIISGGTNIYPIEVENVLLEHPSVEEVAVVGFPDAEWGEIVVAFVVTSGAAPFEQMQTVLDEHCQTHIARFKRPKRYFKIDVLPKNNYGKVVKATLVAQYN